MKEWARMPSAWLVKEGNLPLPTMRWSGDSKADQIAALMLYIVFVHSANDQPSAVRQEIGICELSYSNLSAITGLSRAKISGGIKVLVNFGVIEEISTGRNNVYKIKWYENASGWAKLPFRGLYSKDLNKIDAFQFFHLRKKE